MNALPYAIGVSLALDEAYERDRVESIHQRSLLEKMRQGDIMSHFARQGLHRFEDIQGLYKQWSDPQEMRETYVQALRLRSLQPEERLRSTNDLQLIEYVQNNTVSEIERQMEQELINLVLYQRLRDEHIRKEQKAEKNAKLRREWYPDSETAKKKIMLRVFLAITLAGVIIPLLFEIF